MTHEQADVASAITGLVGAVVSESGLGSPLETALALGVAAAASSARIIEECREGAQQGVRDKG
jgi:hypothetical protein